MYVVTGGAGFIGSNVVAALCARGADVMVVDRLRAGDKWRNLAHHPIAGLLPPEQLEAFLAGAPPIDALINLGAISATTATDGDLVAATNLTLTLRLWAFCAERGIPLLYASSAATYGDGAAGFDDTMDPTELARFRPLNLYGWSKHACDRRVAAMVAAGAAAPPQWAGLKFFNVYGPNEFHKGAQASVVLHKFRQAAAGQPASLFRSDRPDIDHGEQRRDFVHVDDCVAVILWLLDNPTISGLFNVGSGQARTFNDLARAVFAALGRAPDIAFVDLPEALRGHYQYYTQAPLHRLRQAGYGAPMTTLEDGVLRTIREFLSQDDPYR